MRIRCSFECKELPVAYHMMFVSFIKSCLQASNEEYYQQLYWYGEAQNKQSKNFTFAVFLKGYELNKDMFIIRDRVECFVSSPDPEWVVHFYNGLLRQNRFQYQQFQLVKQRVHMIKEKKIDGSFMLCETLSPLYIKNRDNQSLSPHDPHFTNELNYIANLNLKNYRETGLRSSLQFTPLDMKKVVVKEAIHEFQENTNKPYLYVEAYKGRFLLQGDSQDLNDIYQLGIGFRRSSGYGMIEVIHS